MKEYIDKYMYYLNKVMQERCKRVMLSIIESEISRGSRGDGTDAAEDSDAAFTFFSQVCYFRQLLKFRGDSKEANEPAPRGCGIYASHPLRSQQGLEIEAAINSVGETMAKAGDKIVRKMSDYFGNMIVSKNE